MQKKQRVFITTPLFFLINRFCRVGRSAFISRKNSIIFTWGSLCRCRCSVSSASALPLCLKLCSVLALVYDLVLLALLRLICFRSPVCYSLQLPCSDLLPLSIKKCIPLFNAALLLKHCSVCRSCSARWSLSPVLQLLRVMQHTFALV